MESGNFVKKTLKKPNVSFLSYLLRRLLFIFLEKSSHLANFDEKNFISTRSSSFKTFLIITNIILEKINQAIQFLKKEENT